ncbi:MAG: hypothetical protein ACPG7F_00200 [Aggregatilineales bacterium]
MKNIKLSQTVVWRGDSYKVMSSAAHHGKPVYELKDHFTQQVMSAVPSGEIKPLQIITMKHINVNDSFIPFAETLTVNRLAITTDVHTGERINIGAFCQWEGRQVYLEVDEYQLMRVNTEAA